MYIADYLASPINLLLLPISQSVSFFKNTVRSLLKRFATPENTSAALKLDYPPLAHMYIIAFQFPVPLFSPFFVTAPSLQLTTHHHNSFIFCHVIPPIKPPINVEYFILFLLSSCFCLRHHTNDALLTFPLISAYVTPASGLLLLLPPLKSSHQSGRTHGLPY